jgi:nifR3 family TIM-barrel protein
MKKRMHNVLVARRRGDAPAPADGAPERWPLAEPFVIGGLELDNRVVQAPLAGIANWAFRRQSRRHGAGFTVSEMVASMGIHHGNRKTRDMLAVMADERPVGIQLFGGEPEVMAEAARVAVDAGADLVDINMGCPVPKICKTGAGAALLDDMERAEAIVAAMARAVDVPVTVKMRRGMRVGDARPGEAAQRFAAAGAAAIFFHPRAAIERYDGRADHSITAQVVAAVDVPVIASGDITTPEEARAVLEQTGCAAVAIGRAALGNPWAFGAMATGVDAPDRSLADTIAEVHAFTTDVRTALGDHRAGAYLRKFYPWYLAGHDVTTAEREAIVTALTVDHAIELLDQLLSRRGAVAA